ncbi:MAG: hypothetical protein Q8L56_03225 [Rhodocyclaceae bacterium]|nr:hypothetical protein [Rhodocyclaceae bacterium]
MNMRIPSLLCICLLACNVHAASPGDPEIGVPQRLVENSLNQAVPASDPRVAKTREQLAIVMKATGESEQSVAQACMRNARYIFDASRQRVSPLEVLEALAKYAPPGKSINETTQRYFELRVKRRLDHAGALAAFK